LGAFSFSYICFMAKTMGASVVTVYEAVRDLANKDQQGFVTDNEFNSFARLAQLNIFNGLFDELKDSKRLSRNHFNPTRDKDRRKRILEDLSSFSTSATILKSSGVFNMTAASSADMSRIISINTAGSVLLDQSTTIPIEICYDEEKIERILISNISSPTEEFPVALVSDDIHVFPTSINKIKVRYYRYPMGRSSTGVTSTTPVTYTTGSSSPTLIDFELPEHYVSDLVYEIARMIGVNLRDSDVITYTGQEMASKKQAETL